MLVQPQTHLKQITIFSIASVAGTLALRYCLSGFSPLSIIGGTISGYGACLSLYKLCKSAVQMTMEKIEAHNEVDEWDNQIKIIDDILKRGAANGNNNRF